MSQQVTVVTDSAASLPPETAGPAGIVVVPMTLVLEGTVYSDGSLAPDEAARKVASGPVSTSGPSPGDFLEVIEQLPAALILTVSSNMSSTYEAATAAAGYLPPGTVRVLDTGTAAGGEGLVVLAAAEAARGGADLAAVAAVAEHVATQVHLLAALESLEQLARSGRVPGIAAKAGRTLHVHPMFEFADGNARARRPVLSMDGAIDRMVARCLHDRPAPAEGSGDASLRAAVLHANVPERAATLGERLRAAVPDARTYVAPFSSVMVAHTGPGLFGLAWWWDDRR